MIRAMLRRAFVRAEIRSSERLSDWRCFLRAVVERQVGWVVGGLGCWWAGLVVCWFERTRPRASLLKKASPMAREMLRRTFVPEMILSSERVKRQVGWFGDVKNGQFLGYGWCGAGHTTLGGNIGAVVVLIL